MHTIQTTTPALRQLTLQGAAALLVLSLAWPYYGLSGLNLPWPQTAWAIGGVAGLFALVSRQPAWWTLIHTGFAPLAAWTAGFNIDPGWFLAAAIGLLLVYRGALSGQVPLYLSNQATAQTLGSHLENLPGQRFADLGAGIGSMLVPLAKAHPAWSFIGIENSPAPWLLGRLRTWAFANLDWRWGSLWSGSLNEFDVVYAFLSPAPMPDLWRKAQAEMRAGSWLISCTFPVPDVPPTLVLTPDTYPPRPLYLYRM